MLRLLVPIVLFVKSFTDAQSFCQSFTDTAPSTNSSSSVDPTTGHSLAAVYPGNSGLIQAYTSSLNTINLTSFSFGCATSFTQVASGTPNTSTIITGSTPCTIAVTALDQRGCEVKQTFAWAPPVTQTPNGNSTGVQMTKITLPSSFWFAANATFEVVGTGSEKKVLVLDELVHCMYSSLEGGPACDAAP
ncbi:MAG: hypothetical protein M1820_008496 [Bogoriella megaspora]|nr:MAG: hypothetical protein M1820_008496 [Bogoriella megaspora]